MRHEILIAGRGGQGVLLIGRILGVAAAKYCGLYVTSSESYVAETRGGDSRVDIIVADSEDELDFIKVRNADIALFLHHEQLLKFSSLVASGAKVFTDETYVRELPAGVNWVVYRAPYTRVAEDRLGTPRVANIVALGHLVGITRLVPEEAVEKSIDELVAGEWRDVNKKAFKLGLSLSS